MTVKALLISSVNILKAKKMSQTFNNFMNHYKQKEIIGDATLYLGDCLPIMAQFQNKEFDAVVTDPPYGIGEAAGKNKTRIRTSRPPPDKKNTKGTLILAADFGFKEWDHKPPDLRYFIQIKRIADWQIIFGGNYFNLDKTSCYLVWDKKNGGTDFADCELAWTNLKQAVRMISYRWNGMLQENMRDREKRVHPTQKPVKVMEWCIEQIKLKPESTIIDPFMGSGSTGIASHRLGHKFIGVEQDEEYFDIACKRIEQAQRQLNLFS